MNIIQTWKTKEVPEHYRGFVNAVKELNPDCNYMLFDDKDIVDFITTKMPEYYDTFCGLSNKIQQIDFFRYLAIYHYGGVYLDLDMDIVKPFSNDLTKLGDKCVFPIEIHHNSDFLLHRQDVSYLVGNYAFYAPKGHPFVLNIINNIIIQRIHTADIELAQRTSGDPPNDVYVYYRTGPVLVTQTYIDHKNKGDVLLLQSSTLEENRFGDYGFHRFYGSWKHPGSDQKSLE